MLQIEDFKKKITKNSRLLGLDLGKKRIGVAICDDKRIIATPYKTIIKENFDQFLSELLIIIKDNNISGIVVGNPINMDGTSGASVHSVKDTVNLLSKNITLPITMWDERLSSEATFKITKELGTNTTSRVNKLDKNAAAYILQGAIDYLSN